MIDVACANLVLEDLDRLAYEAACTGGAPWDSLSDDARVPWRLAAFAVAKAVIEKMPPPSGLTIALPPLPPLTLPPFALWPNDNRT